MDELWMLALILFGDMFIPRVTNSTIRLYFNVLSAKQNNKPLSIAIPYIVDA